MPKTLTTNPIPIITALIGSFLKHKVMWFDPHNFSFDYENIESFYIGTTKEEAINRFKKLETLSQLLCLNSIIIKNHERENPIIFSREALRQEIIYLNPGPSQQTEYKDVLILQ